MSFLGELWRAFKKTASPIYSAKRTIRAFKGIGELSRRITELQAKSKGVPYLEKQLKKFTTARKRLYFRALGHSADVALGVGLYGGAAVGGYRGTKALYRKIKGTTE